jgi:hypothetical protein
VPSQHQSTSHFRRSARTSGIDPTSDNSMQGIQFQLIGLLGETFVSTPTLCFTPIFQTTH